MRRELNETSRQPATTTDRGGTVHRAHRRRLHLRHDAVPGQSRAGSIHRRHQRDHRGRAGRSHHPRTGPDVGGCRLRRHQCAYQEAVPRPSRQPRGSRGHLPDDRDPIREEGTYRLVTADQHGRAWHAKTAAWLHAHHQRLTAWRRDELLICHRERSLRLLLKFWIPLGDKRAARRDQSWQTYSRGCCHKNYSINQHIVWFIFLVLFHPLYALQITL